MSWDGAAGIGGFVERTFAPPAIRGLYLDALDRLNAYAASHPKPTSWSRSFARTG